MKPRHTPIAVVLAAALSLAVAAPAQAGTYKVRECFATEGYPGYLAADVAFSTGGPGGASTYGASDDYCNDSSAYVGVGDVGIYGSAWDGDYARATLAAPAGTAIASFSATAAAAADYGHETRIRALSGGSYTTFHLGSNAQNNHQTTTASWSGAAGEVDWQIGCEQAAGCAASGSGIWLSDIELELSDTSDPQVVGIDTEGTLADGAWHRGPSGIVADVKDAGSGVRSAALEVNGGVPTHEYTFSDCAHLASGYAGQLSPCWATETQTGEPIVKAYSVSLDTASSPFQSGINDVAVCARDYANMGGTPNKGCQSFQAKIDNRAPQQAISGPGWGPPGFTILPGKHEIDVDATDGVFGGAALDHQSGVEQIEISIDPDASGPTGFQLVHTEAVDPICDGDSCPLSTTYELDTSEWGRPTTDEAIDITVEVASTDKVGNPPVIARRTLTIANEREKTSTDVTFKFPAGTAPSGECELDGGGWESCPSPKTYKDLPNGDHTLRFR